MTVVSGLRKFVFREYMVISILTLVHFLYLSDFLLMMSLGGELMLFLHITPPQLGMLITAYTFSAAVFGFLGAFFLDRFERKDSFMFVFTGFVIGIMVCALSPNYSVFLCGRIITGAFAGNLMALVLSLLGDTVSRSRTGTATSIVMSAFSIASLISIPAGLFLSNEITWRTPFNIIAGIALVVLICICLFFPETENVSRLKTPKRALVILRSVFTNKDLVKILLFMFFLVSSGFSIMLFISPFLIANVGISQSQLASVYFLSGLGSIISGPFIGKIIDRFGEEKIFITCALISVITTTMITSMDGTGKYMAMTMAVLFLIFQNSRFISATSLMTSRVDAENRVSLMGINASIQQLTGGVSALISGWILIESPEGKLMNFEVIGMISVVCTVLSILISSRIKSIA
ncbi:MAG: MFS transporter [Cytophagaceae bacterium]